MKTHITAELMQRIYALHKKGVDPATIAQVLTLSRPSTTRVIAIMRAAESGDAEAVYNLYGTDNYKRQKAKACELYGISASVAAPVDDTPTEAATADTADSDKIANIGYAVIDLLLRQNALIERFCAAFGVDTETGDQK